MSLDTAGTISAVLIAIYVPILFFAVRIGFRYGMSERGWLLLAIFSLFRIIGNALFVAAETTSTSDTINLLIGSGALDMSGLSPLLLSTLGLLEIIAQWPERVGRQDQAFMVVHIIGLVAMVLVIYGTVAVDIEAENSFVIAGAAITELRAGVLLFAALYIILVGITMMQWTRRYRLMKYRKQLLFAITATLPFLAVRVLYSVLPVFLDSTILGEWQTYVAMEAVMEYVTAVIYVLAGILIPLDQDYTLWQGTYEYPL